MADKPTLVDPVAEDQAKQEQAEQIDQVQTLATDALSLEDFQPVPVTAARPPHPFEGYPQRKIKIGTYKVGRNELDLIVSAAHVVALNPKLYVHQDPSGLNQTINVGGKEKVVNYLTSHSRVVRNEKGGNEQVIFDREITLGDGKKMARCAIVKDHTARAQIIFKVDKKTGKILVDDRYVLADGGQASRLRRLFEMFHFQQTQSERLAKKFDEEPASEAN